MARYGTDSTVMRILLLNYEFPPVGGGAATAASHIAAQLARRGVEVAVLTSHFEGLQRRERIDGYTVHRVPVARRRLDRCSPWEMGAFMLGAAVPALRLARAFRPDLMHVYFGMPTGPVGLLIQQLEGVPYLLSLRGGDVPGFLGAELALLHRLALPLTRLTWSRAAALVVNGQGLRLLAAHTAPGRRIEVIPNGIDLEAFRPMEGNADADGRIRLLFVGRLVRQKGLPYLLRSLALLDPALRERVCLELVGSGPEEKPLRRLAAELGLEKRIRFTGWVARPDIPACYQKADVFVLPSLDEGMPNVVLEALACGKPVVATDIRGNRELVQEGLNGTLVPPADAAALARALAAMISNRALREQMGLNARASVARHGWAEVAGRYLDLSEEIIGTLATGPSRVASRTPQE